jgi:mRNA-degrading endonuclease RelE of RelBE toxin-antitoxin system
LSYDVVFPSERVARSFQKLLSKIPADYRDAIITAVRSLATDPRPEGKRTKKLTGELIVSQFTAQYRLRVGPYRLLYDIDHQRKKVILLKLAKQAFLPRRAWTVPRSTGNFRSEPHPRAENCGMAPLFFFYTEKSAKSVALMIAS